MIYLELKPAAPLACFIRSLWYTRAPHIEHRLERVLPTGRVQVILNLARDYMVHSPEGRPKHPVAPELVIGARSIYEIIDSSDMADLIGIVFQPGGFAPFAGDAVDLFSNRNWSLDDVWGSVARSLRDRLREIDGPHARLRYLEEFLSQRFAARLDRQSSLRTGAVEFALNRFERAPGMATVREVARGIGWSERRFSQVFREEVGFSPKMWCRIQRFQRTVARLHAGVEIPWSQLALDCGFYDQSHFANEFRAFSGIDATTYSALRPTRWANHVPVA
ncbi:MAG: helix-turn-helix domain-containing protein [Terracidiphilus sp.]